MRQFVAVAVLMVLAGWIGQYLYSRTDMPDCANATVKRELTRSLADMTSTAPKDISTERYRERETTVASPAVGAQRVCAADAVIADDGPTTVRFNIVTDPERAGYQVQVAEVRPGMGQR